MVWPSSRAEASEIGGSEVPPLSGATDLALRMVDPLVVPPIHRAGALPEW
jgi:hypothetical protein